MGPQNIPSLLNLMNVYPFQGKEIIEFYMKELEDEGVTHIPRWAPAPAFPVASSTPARLELPVTPSIAIPVSSTRDANSNGECTGSSPPGSPVEPPAGTPDGEWTVPAAGPRQEAQLAVESQNYASAPRVVQFTYT